MPTPADRVRCVSCRAVIEVPGSFAHGDRVSCGTCGTSHRVLRNPSLRLVVADVGPLKEALHEGQQRARGLEKELADARASLGIGINGLGIGVAWAVYRVAQAEAALDVALLMQAAIVALVSGAALEVLNYFFLAKRQKMRLLAEDLETQRPENKLLQQKIRDAGRP